MTTTTMRRRRTTGAASHQRPQRRHVRRRHRLASRGRKLNRASTASCTSLAAFSRGPSASCYDDEEDENEAIVYVGRPLTSVGYDVPLSATRQPPFLGAAVARFGAHDGEPSTCAGTIAGSRRLPTQPGDGA